VTLSSSVPVPQSSTPNHHLFYTMDENASLTNLILQVYLPKIDPKTLVALVGTQGHVFLQSKSSGGPNLTLHLEFKLNVPECSGTFYSGDEVLLLTLPLVHGEEPPKSNTSVTITTSMECSSIIPLDPEWEIDTMNTTEIPTEENCQISESGKSGKKTKLDQALEKIEKINIPKSESEYSNLYNEIDKAWTIHQEEGQQASSSKNSKEKPTSQPKIGRNDMCPCGSDRKYKQCHGKSLIK